MEPAIYRRTDHPEVCVDREGSVLPSVSFGEQRVGRRKRRWVRQSRLRSLGVT